MTVSRLGQLLITLVLLATTSAQRARNGRPLCTSRADVCFLIDSSGSIRDNNPTDGSHDNWQLLLSFLQTVVDEFDVGVDKVRFGAVKFSNSADLMFNLAQYLDKASIRRAIQDTSYIGGFTNTYEGLRLMHTACFGQNNGDRPSVPNIAIVVTDGLPTMNQDKWAEEAARVKADNIFIMAVGITDQIDNATLRELSSPPQMLDRTYFTSPDFRRLDTVIEQLVSKTCEVPTAAPATPTPPHRTLPPACPFGADVVFIMDASDSIVWSDTENWQRMRTFVSDVSRSFPIDNGQFRVGVVRFARFANIEFFLSMYNTNADVVNAINSISLASDGSGTNIGDALKLTREEVFRVGRGDRRDSPNIGIIITDGRDSVPDRAVTAADQLRATGVELFTIGITEDVDMEQLTRIASAPSSNHVFQVGDFARLDDIIANVIRRACAALSTTSAPPTTTLPATIPPPSDCKGSAADVIFLLDASGSIGDLNFQRIRQFVSDVINDLDIETGKIRVGLATFSDGARLQFNLNQYSSRVGLLTTIKAIPYTQGTTNMADALRMARTDMFTSAAGDRADARNMIVMVTDGKSDNGVETRKQAALLKASGVHITSVAIGSWLDLDELAAVASFPSDQNVMRVNDFSTLDRLRTGIRDYICDNTNECRPNPCDHGRCRDGIGLAYCECEPGYGGPKCDQRCQSSSDVVFVLDNSGSIRRENFNKMMVFVRDTVSYLGIDGTGQQGTRVGVVSYSDDVQPQFNLNTYTDARTLLSNLNVRYTGGTTNTAAAIRYIRNTMFRQENGDRPGVPNVAVVMTDGRSDDPDATWKAAMEARKAGIQVIVVGIGQGVSDMELRSMASDPVDNNVFSVDDFDSLQSISTTVSDGLCNNQDGCASNPCQNGATCRDTLTGYDCSPCMTGYTGYNCERECTGVADVAFLVDASGSIRRERFPIIIDFIKDVVNNLDVHPDQTRIAAVYWSEHASVQFNLRDYTNRQDVVQAVQRIPFIGGKTFTTSALRKLREETFTGRAGDRPGVQNYVIVITDGNSNISPEQTIPEAIKLRNEGAHVIVVAIGNDVNSAELRGMASYPKAVNIYNVKRISQLPSLRQDIIKSFCNDANECLSNPCRNGGRCVNGLRIYTCMCQGDWTDINCNRRCPRKLDVTLILDLSGSVTEQKELILAFARRMASGLNMQEDRVRVAAVAFATDIIDRFYLNTYTSKREVINALTFYHKSGKTNIPAALRVTREDVFVQSRGDRARVPNAAILITDGHTTVDRRSTIPQAAETKRRGVELFTVAVGKSPNMAALTEVASAPSGDHVYRLPSANDLERTIDQILTYICQ